MIKTAKKIILVMISVLLSFSTFSCASTQKKLTGEQVYATASASVCEVNSLYAKGTGFVIALEESEFFVLTNKHVLVSSSSIDINPTIKFLNGASYSTEVIGYSTYHDLAVIKVSKAAHEGLTALEFSNSAPIIGQQIYSIGNAIELGLAFFEGMVSFDERFLSIDSEAKRVPVVQVTLPINAGSSGAPILDEYAKVKGVATYQISYYQSRSVDGVSFYVDGRIAKAVAGHILSAHKANSQNGEATLLDVKLTRLDINNKVGLEIFALNLAGNLSDMGLVVTDCSSLESDAGVQLAVGDVITKLGSLDLKGASLSDIFIELYKYADERAYSDVDTSVPLKLEFMRQDKKNQMTVLNKYEKNS